MFDEETFPRNVALIVWGKEDAVSIASFHYFLFEGAPQKKGMYDRDSDRWLVALTD